jgi:Epoxide hydrolase N terminus
MSTAESTAQIRPFSVETPQSEIDDLRRRIAATRFPEKETVEDQSQGLQLATAQALTRYDLIHYNKLDKGGHFAAWEQPQLFCEDVRAGFRSLR